MVSILLLLSYYDYNYCSTTCTDGIARPPIPSWVWFYCAAAYFTGYTLDGIDGKQARRLKASSPVGMYMYNHLLHDNGASLQYCILTW